MPLCQKWYRLLHTLTTEPGVNVIVYIRNTPSEESPHPKCNRRFQEPVKRKVRLKFIETEVCRRERTPLAV